MYVYTHAPTHTHVYTSSMYTHTCMCTCVYADASSLPLLLPVNADKLPLHHFPALSEEKVFRAAAELILPSAFAPFCILRSEERAQELFVLLGVGRNACALYYEMQATRVCGTCKLQTRRQSDMHLFHLCQSARIIPNPPPT